MVRLAAPTAQQRTAPHRWPLLSEVTQSVTVAEKPRPPQHRPSTRKSWLYATTNNKLGAEQIYRS